MFDKWLKKYILIMLLGDHNLLEEVTLVKPKAVFLVRNYNILCLKSHIISSQ